MYLKIPPNGGIFVSIEISSDLKNNMSAYARVAKLADALP